MSTFYDPTFYDKLDILRRRLGDSVKDNVLEYFLKQSNGDINRCVALLKDDGWFPPRLTNNLPPERSVQLQQSNRPTPTTSQPIGTTVRPTDHTPHYTGSATLPRTNHPSTSPVLVPRRDHFVSEFPMEPNHNIDFLSSHQTGPSPLKVSPPPFPKEGPRGFQPVPSSLVGPQVLTPYQHPNHSPPGNHHHSSSHFPVSMPAQHSSSGSNLSSLGPNPIPYDHQYRAGGLSSSFDQPDMGTSLRERTLHYQEQQLQKAKAQHEQLLRQLSAAKGEVQDKKRSLSDLKRYNSRSGTKVADDDFYMAESINKTLKDDVESARMKKKEGDPRKWQPEAVPREIPIHRRQSWKCSKCHWSNSHVMMVCEACQSSRGHS